MLLAQHAGIAIDSQANGGAHRVMKCYTVYSPVRACERVRVPQTKHAGVANRGVEKRQVVADASRNTGEGNYHGACGTL